MNKEELRKEIFSLIDKIEDEKLLNMIKEDIAIYQAKDKEKNDDLSDLTSEEKELITLATEDAEKDTVTEKEFKKHIQEWRKRSSTKTVFK